jgi:hypothetical protein
MKSHDNYLLNRIKTLAFFQFGSDKFYLSLFGFLAVMHVIDAVLDSFSNQSISIPQVLSSREAIFRLSLHGTS